VCVPPVSADVRTSAHLSRRGLDARTPFLEARARNARVEATSDRPCPAQVKRALFAGGGDRFADLHFLATGPLDAGGLDVAGSSGAGNATILKQDASILGWTCGNVVATATAAARFFHDLLVAKTLLNATTLAEAETFAPIDNGWGERAIQYGLGLMIQQTNARGPYPPKLADDGAYVGHGGDTYGFLSEQGYYPTAAATIAVVANEDQRGNFVKNALACGAYKVVANVTMGRDAAVDCAV
jgi:hypothetical protein